MDSNDRHEQESVEYDVQALRAEMLACLGTYREAYPKALEAQYPRILARIVEMWGRAELDAYLGSLLVSERHGRQGFPPDVAMEVFKLMTLYGSLGFAPKQKSGSGWAGIDDAELFKHHVTRESK
jgi:hypothetical protein